MAQLVGAYGVPHTPAFPRLVDLGIGPADQIAEFYSLVRASVSEAKPDVIVVLADDHINTFFLDNFPALAVGVDDESWGPNDGTEGLAPRSIRTHRGMALHLLESLTGSGFELAQSQRFSMDHAMVVPLHFLDPEGAAAMVPLWINELVPPIPTAQRAYALGRSLRQAIDAFPGSLRVAVVASGSFSLEVGGVHIDPNSNYGVPDPEWTSTVVEHLRAGRPEELIALATPERLHRAGNVGGELLAWLAVWALAHGEPPVSINVQAEFGHAYAIWEVTA